MNGITGLLKRSFAKYNGGLELASLVFSESLGLTALPSKFPVVTIGKIGSTTETELHFESSQEDAQQLEAVESFLSCGLPIGVNQDIDKIGVVEQIGIDVLAEYIKKNLDVKNKGYHRVLSIDGGGARGIIALRMLNKIEQATGKKIYQLFDHIAGTSAGGLIALCISLGLSCEEIVLADSKINIFNSHFKRADALRLTLKDCLKQLKGFEDDIFDQDLKTLSLSMPNNVKLLIPSIMEYGDLEEVFPSFFSNYDSIFSVPNEKNNILTAAAATSSIMNFICERFEYDKFSRDGGYLCNNPAVYAFCASLSFHLKYPSLFVSLGTGQSGSRNAKFDHVSAVLNGNSELVHERMESLFPFQQKKDYPEHLKIYHRINPNIEDLYDDVDPEIEQISVAWSADTVQQSIDVVDKWIERNDNLFQPIIQRLQIPQPNHCTATKSIQYSYK